MNHVLKAIALITLLSTVGLAQRAAKPAFNVADIQASRLDEKPDHAFRPDGTVTLRSMTTREMIAAAWNLNADYITGGPDWLDKEHYSLAAKTAAGTPETEMREMLKSLLIERLKLQVHVEKQPMPVFVMVVAKDGPKLRETSHEGSGASCELQRKAPVLRTFACQDVDMDNLTGFLPRIASAYIDRPVLDRTELRGSYDFTLAWIPAQQTGGPTIFVALETQLGLRLERQNHPMDTIVIDRAEHVTAR